MLRFTISNLDVNATKEIKLQFTGTYVSIIWLPCYCIPLERHNKNWLLFLTTFVNKVIIYFVKNINYPTRGNAICNKFKNITIIETVQFFSLSIPKLTLIELLSLEPDRSPRQPKCIGLYQQQSLLRRCIISSEIM